MAISHKVKFTQCVAFDPARHAIGNLPQCAFCHHKFDTWHALKQHIQRLNCPILMQQVGLTGAVAPGASLEVRPSVAGRQPGHEDPDIQTCVEKNGWTALLDSPHAQHFRQHCSLCNRWIKDPTALKRHLKQTHGDLWDSVAPALEAKCAEVKQQLTRDGTCPWCERTSYSRHYHQCNVIFQSALLGLKRAKPTRRGGRGRGQSLCQEQIGNVVTMLASLCLQQEDALNRIRLETPHTMHLAQQGQGAVLKALYNAGTAWQVKKNSGEPVQALRVVLFGLLLAETQARIQLFSKDDAAVKAAQANHILDKDKRFVYQKWDAQASKLVTDPDKKGLTLEEVMAILTELRKLSNDQTITKFNASRRLRKEPDNDEKAVFTVEVAMRSPPAIRIQGLLDQMTDNAAWGLVAAQLRPPSLNAKRASQRHPEGPGGRLDGPIQPGRCSPRSAPPLCPITVPPPVASQRMRNLSNTCYINSLTFTILWQVQQRVDIIVPEAWQRAQAQGTWIPANVLRFTMLGWRQPDQINSMMSLSLCSSCFLAFLG